MNWRRKLTIAMIVMVMVVVPAATAEEGTSVTGTWKKAGGGGGGDVLRRARETKKNAGENGHCHHLTSSEARTLESPSARKAPTPTRSTVRGCPAV